MTMDDDTESCGSRPAVEPYGQQQNPREQNQKLEVYNEVLQRLQESSCEEAHLPGFDEDLWVHFNRLPARYALDVNAERAEDVLAHKRLLKLAKSKPNQIVFEVRAFQVNPNANGNDAVVAGNDQTFSNHLTREGPTFGNNLEEVVPQSDEFSVEDEDSVVNSKLIVQQPRLMREITFSTLDKPKLLSQLTALLAEIGLNIQEAHAFSTVDGFSLDVFVVDGLPSQEDDLRKDLEKGIMKLQDHIDSRQRVLAPLDEKDEKVVEFYPIQIPTDGSDVWEIDVKQLKMGEKVASGTYGELYRGSYCSQEVAIKILKGHVNQEIIRDFSQEIYIMRKIRHKNVVQFIGACTQPTRLCIVTEFMSKGSIYDFLHKRKGAFKLPGLLKVAIDVSKGMNYLHQNNIIHRDLKSANLLMDENEVVKVADFGVAKVMTAENGVMTAETGTYRWMAPEVIGHKSYNHKADVFSFGILLWELLTGELPYSHLTPLQAAVGVVQKDLRPTIPKNTNPKLVELLQRCWQRDPRRRPNFSDILESLQQIAKEVEEEGGDRSKDKPSGGGIFGFIKSVHH